MRKNKNCEKSEKLQIEPAESKIIILLTPVFAFCAPPVVLEKGKGEYPLGLHLDLLEDKEGKWTLEDVISLEFDGKFVVSEQEIPFFYGSGSVYWARFNMNVRPEDQREWLISVHRWIPSQLYLPTTKGDYIKKVTDPLADFSEREIKHPDFILNLPKNFDYGKYIYMRVEATANGYIRIDTKIWSKNNLFEDHSDYLYIQGVYYGFIIVMMLYNFFIFFSVREQSYLYYVAYVAMFGLYMLHLTGLGFQYIWSNNPGANVDIWVYFGTPAFFFLLKFMQTFIQTKHYVPRTHVLVNVLAYIWLALFPIYFYLRSQSVISLVYYLGLMTAIVGVILLILCIKRGSRAAMFIMIAFSFFSIGGILRFTAELGILPINALTTYAVQLGSAFEVVLLSLALADRINTMNKKLTTQAVVLEDNAVVLKKNALELQEYSEQLEEKVEIRTGELSEANSELSKKNEQIHDSLRYSVTMQHSLIPDKNILKQSFQDHFVIWEPRDVVSGDIYFCFPTQTGCLLAVIDCTGHGVPGAFIVTAQPLWHWHSICYSNKVAVSQGTGESRIQYLAKKSCECFPIFLSCSIT